ncbi:uncharacterized protein LOC113516706 [Galleria mellonella]|uniref:Uncharacterized protein LOC113516706 n=1 Tax=Galleria mellonella TaxID=7137 RepID=A0A6J1WVX1_GALME|nr:uncharacterized protein LOC113516706 [Galleria mellonella]
MNYIYTARNRYRLVSRNEGKIKSYESCSDVRAWSHDVSLRDRYLREWMKSDMPICVIPVYTLTSFLKSMTCTSRRRATPKCHPNCKSKMLLESICTSCHMIKECLKNDSQFEKYFEEEEFETCHWPCDRCLNVLKSIKMLWKIIIEKIFNVNYKDENFCSINNSRTDSVQSIVKVWEKEMVEQALFVKNIGTFSTKSSSLNSKHNYCAQKQVDIKKEVPSRIPAAKDAILKREIKKSKINLESDRILNGNSSISNDIPAKRKFSRSTSVRVKTVNKSCDACNIKEENEELKTYKYNLEYLQQQHKQQETEMEILKRENKSLKLELQSFYKTCSWKSTHYNPSSITKNVVPKPFECCVEENKEKNTVKNLESEMIITMKNCKNKSYRHVSLFQVLHKTNGPVITNDSINKPNDAKENPIDILTKVQNAFGELVSREMSIVNKSNSNTDSQIHASFYRVSESKSAPSCSTILSDSSSIQSCFVSL